MTAASAPTEPVSRPELVELAEADQERFDDYLEEMGWSDGLPAVPPTPARVEAMLAAAPGGLEPTDELGAMPPRQGVATIEHLAINAVMAGCRPQHFPVLVAAVEAALDPSFNLFAVQATTHPCSPLLIVNGPVADEVGINARYGAFGPGHRANATIGRAMRLTLLNARRAPTRAACTRSGRSRPACRRDRTGRRRTGRARARARSTNSQCRYQGSRPAATMRPPCSRSATSRSPSARPTAR